MQNPRSRVAFAALAVTAATLAVAGPAGSASAAAPVTRYQVTRIQTAAGDFGDAPFAINAAGDTAGIGTFLNLGLESAFLSTGGGMTNLPGPSSDPTDRAATVANGINDADTVVGTAHLSFPSRQAAVVWRNGRPTELKIPLPADFDIEAVAVNNAGQIAGSGLDTGKAWLYQNGTTTLLPALPGGAVAEALGLTADGKVLGVTTVNADINQGHATVWQNGRPADLGTLPGGSWSEAHAMNRAGLAVGAASADGGFVATRHPVLFQAGHVIDLWPDLGSTTSGSANAVNNAGVVVGDGRNGWVYRDGVRTDLSTLIPPEAGLRITAAYGINDAGQIAAVATPIGQPRQRFAVLLTPIAG
jgi:uncharacterized membrane protein